MSYSQGQIEGLGVDRRQARLMGTFEISDDDDRDLSLDRVVVMIVAGRSTKIEHSVLETGEVLSRRVVKVSDVMPLVGDMRDEAIRRLSRHADPNQGVLEWSSGDQHDDQRQIEAEASLEPSPEPEVSPSLEVASPNDIWSPSPGGDVTRMPIRTQRRDSTLDRFLQEDF